MIIKIDHITQVVNRDNVEEVMQSLEEQAGYIAKFKEYELKNIEVKKNIMRNSTDLHDMFFMEKPNTIPIEVITYFQTEQGYPYVIKGNEIDIRVKNVAEAGMLLKIMGAKEIESDTRYNVRGIFDKSDIYVNIIRSEQLCKRYLDDEGIGCLTVLVDSVDKLKNQFTESNIVCTEIGQIEVAGKLLNIMFASTSHNEFIVEFISNRR